MSYHPYRQLRVRTRLLLAFATLSLSAMIVAFVGWRGLSDTESALNVFQQDALPDVSRSLELAERTANLAALAPYVASANSPFMLQELTQELETKIQNVLALAHTIPQLDASAPKLRGLLERLDVSVGDLIELSRQQLFLREDIREYTYRLDKLELALQEMPLSEIQRSQANHSLDLLFAASFTPSINTLQQSRMRFIQLQSNLKNHFPDGDWLATMESIALGKQGFYHLREQQISMQQRSAFLLSATRAISEQMSGEVKRFVDQIERRIASESQVVGNAVHSGKTGILLISLLSIFSAIAGVWVVKGLTRSLGSVTQVMTRLAEGDKHQKTPEIDRGDEIGDLARAFQVFRENAVTMDRITLDLEEQSRLLNTVFTNINDGLSVFDRAGRLVAWNPQYLKILELPEASLTKGMHLEEVHALLSTEARESWALNGMALDDREVKVLRYMQSQRFERHFANGKVVEFRSNPMPEGGFVTLHSDLTERKAVEAQLRQSQKMEVLGQLTGGVAHDFNNLLAAMFGNLQLLESSLPEGEKPLKYARRALASAERGRNLTQRLLAFSRKQHLQPEVVKVDELIEGMFDLIEYSVGTAIDISLNLGVEQWEVDVDPGQLENALLNLAINSSAAMPNGGVLKFRTCQLKGAQLGEIKGDIVQIQVQDTGCGIEKSHLRRVFEPFFTTKEIGEGSGLGLSMVYGFVKQSNGDIQVHSEPGKGTRIDISLPRSVISIDTRTIEKSPIKLGNGRLVLMVEDDVQVREMGAELLAALDYEVITTHSGEGALAILEARQDIDVLFTDINLGTSTTGMQLAEQVERQWPNIGIVITSGLSMQNLDKRYGITDSHFVLPKPYRTEELAIALQRINDEGS